MIEENQNIEYENSIFRLSKIFEEIEDIGITEDYRQELKKNYEWNMNKQDFLINYLIENDMFEYKQFKYYMDCFYIDINDKKENIVGCIIKNKDNYGNENIEILLKFLLIYASDEKIILFFEIIEDQKIEIDVMNDNLLIDNFHSALSICILMKRNIEIIKLLCVPRSEYKEKEEIIKSDVHGRLGKSILILCILGNLSKEIIFYFLENGADPFKKDKNNMDAFEYLEISNYDDEDKKEILEKMLCKIHEQIKIIGEKRKYVNITYMNETSKK